jgi:type IV pilus assembly protein PilB
VKNIPIGEVLRELGYITKEQLEQALMEQAKDNSKRLGSIIVELGFITEHQLLEALAQRLNIRLISIQTYPVDINSVIRIPKHLAVKYKAIAIGERDGSLIVAVNDPLNLYAIEDIRQLTVMPVVIVLSLKEEIENAIEYYYSEAEAKQAVIKIQDDTIKSEIIAKEEEKPAPETRPLRHPLSNS